MKIAAEKETQFAEKNKGMILSALVEEGGNENSLFGYTENYIRVVLKKDGRSKASINNLVPVRITNIENGDFHAEIA